MDNDSLHKFAYRHRELFVDLLRLAVPSLADELALDDAEEVSAAHVSADVDGLKQRHGDMTWRVPFKAGALRDGTRPYLLVPLEFQSTVDRTMRTRMRDYGEMLRQRLLADGTAQREGSLPWLLPVVLYNGQERWTADTIDLAPLPSTAVRQTLARHQSPDYVLISLERLVAAGGRNLRQLPRTNRAAATMRLQLARTVPRLRRRLRVEESRFRGTGNAAARRVLRTWAQALLADMAEREGGPATAALMEALEAKEQEDMTTIAQAELGQWYREFSAKKVAEGAAQERTRALARSLAMIQQMAAIKFGDGIAEQLAALLGTANTTEQIEAAGIAIIECGDGDELLARVSATG